jgi:hypothetical protein
MNKKKAKISRETESFYEKVDALLGAPPQREIAEIEGQLRLEGIDPERLGQSAHTRLRELAVHRYLSLGKDVPLELQEAIRQLRPPTAEQIEEREMSQANSTIKDFLAKIKAGAASILDPGVPDAAFAPAFRRNKRQPLSENDQEILDAQQSEVNTESEKKRKNNE